MAFYFMLDFLRSMHYQMPASFLPDDLSIPLSTGLPFRRTYHNLILGTDDSLPTDLSNNDLLLLLLGIVSDVLALQHMLGPTFSCPSNHPGLCHLASMDVEPEDIGSSMLHDETPGLSDGFESFMGHARETYDPASQYTNPFLPFTALEEYRRMSRILMVGLGRWRHMFLLNETSPQREEKADYSVMALFHLGRLLLSAGPDLLAFSAAVGYGDEGISDADVPPKPHISKAVLKISWAILEAIEAQHRASQTTGLTPLWNPIAAFYAALVAWASIDGKENWMDRVELSQTRRMFRLLRLELEDMVWPCAAAMSSILRDLELRSEAV